MIVSQSSKPVTGSIKKAQKALERKLIIDIEGNVESILPHNGYWFCDKCEDNTPHKIYTDKTMCWMCNESKVIQYKPSIRSGKSKTVTTVLFMI